MGGILEQAGGWTSFLVALALGLAINSVILWVVSNKIIRLDNPPSFLRSALCVIVLDVAFIIAVLIAAIPLAIVGAVIGLVLGQALMFLLVIVVSLLIMWWVGNRAIESVFDLKGGGARSILAVYLVVSITVSFGSNLVMGSAKSRGGSSSRAREVREESMPVNSSQAKSRPIPAPAPSAAPGEGLAGLLDTAPTPSPASSTSAATAASSPTRTPTPGDLAPADLLLQEAGKDWDAGRYQRSISNAENALAIYKRWLGESDSKVAEVLAMIDAAKKELDESKAK